MSMKSSDAARSRSLLKKDCSLETPSIWKQKVFFFAILCLENICMLEKVIAHNKVKEKKISK